MTKGRKCDFCESLRRAMNPARYLLSVSGFCLCPNAREHYVVYVFFLVSFPSLYFRSSRYERKCGTERDTRKFRIRRLAWSTRHQGISGDSRSTRQPRINWSQRSTRSCRVTRSARLDRTTRAKRTPRATRSHRPERKKR